MFSIYPSLFILFNELFSEVTNESLVAIFSVKYKCCFLTVNTTLIGIFSLFEISQPIKSSVAHNSILLCCNFIMFRVCSETNCTIKPLLIRKSENALPIQPPISYFFKFSIFFA